MRAARALLVCALAAAVVAGGGRAATPSAVVSIDRTQIDTDLGRTFAFTSTVGTRERARSRTHRPSQRAQPAPGRLRRSRGLVVNRTRYLPAIPPGGSLRIAWRVKAVNSGSFGIYVAVLPSGATAVPPFTGPTVQVAVAERRTLNSGGILPLALGVPAALALLALGVRRRRRG